MRKHPRKSIWAAIGAVSFLALLSAIVALPNPGRAQASRPRISSASYPIALHYDAAQVRVEKVQVGGKPYIQLHDPALVYATRVVGLPALPQDEIYVALPPDATNVRLELNAASSVTVARGVRVAPVQPPLITGTAQLPALRADQLIVPRKGEVPPIAIDEKAYTSDTPYPPQVATLEVVTLFGAKVAVVHVSPFVYFSGGARTDLRTALGGSVAFETSQSTKELYADLSRAQREALIKTVINPDVIVSKTSESVLNKTAAAVVAPLTSHADYIITDARPTRHETVDYVVITRAALVTPFKPLVASKIGKGVNARIVTVEWIATRYAGVDLSNKIRNFILDAHVKWGASWFLLGGDVDQVPTRLGAYDWITASYGPMDLYYSGLGTNWNANGDHVFAQPGEEDLFPDIFVGRAPVQNAAQVSAFFNKVFLYETQPPAGYVQRALLMGVHNNLGSDAFTQTNILLQLPSSFTVKRMYDPSSTLLPDYILNYANAMTQLEQGYHILSHMDHSGVQSMGTGAQDGGGAIVNTDVDSLNNPLPGFIVWTFGCDPNAFDYDSISEHWLRNAHGGGVAFVGNSRTGWSDQGTQGLKFFQSWFTTKLRHVGAIFSTTQGTGFGWNPRYESEAMNLLGDPEMVVWNAQPSAMTLTGLGTIKTGPNSLNLIVGGLPAGQEAVVTFRGPNGEVYSGAQTVGGVLTGTLIVENSPLAIVVTSPDRTPLINIVPVVTSSNAHLYISNAQIVDTGTGNANQRLEPGESALLRVTIRNSGGATAAAGPATLTTSTVGVMITLSSIGLPALAPAGSATVDFPIALTHTFADGAALLFDLQTVGAGIEHTDVHVPVFAPVLEQTHTYDDSAGNDDGIPQPGETVKFGLHVINNGFGDADAVTATLTSTSTHITITDGSATVGNVLGKNVANSSDTFTLVLGAAFNPNIDTVTLTMTDSLANTTTQVIKLVVPAAPTGMGYRSTATSITALWDAAVPALRNYKIYRSNIASGPYTNIEPFLVHDGALYEDDTINPSQPSYYYRVAIIDAFGNESAPGQVQAWTSLPVLSGFPRPILPSDNAVSGHTVAFDVKGNGQKDIFVTTGNGTISGTLYAWKPDGSELILKGDPAFAEFATLDGANSGAPAFADIDGDGHTDIIVNGVYRIYAFHADGTPVAGWAGGVPIPKPDTCMGNPPSVFNTSPIVADLDGDGHPEIVTTAFDWGEYCAGSDMRLYVFNANGSLKTRHDIPGGNYSYATPAVADLNGDGRPELVIPVSNGQIWVLNSIGPVFSAIATIPGAAFQNEANLVDLDFDGVDDIVAASQEDTNTGATRDGRLFALHLNGTPVAGWAGGKPIDAGDAMVSEFSYGPTIATGDIDGDGWNEIVLGTEQKVYVWRHDGVRESGWPVLRENKSGDLASAASPLIADVNGDHRPDVLISSSSLLDQGLIYAWDGQTGAPIAGYPQFIPEVIPRTGAYADLRGDGSFELVQAAGSHVYAFKTVGHATGLWPNIDRDAVHSSAILP